MNIQLLRAMGGLGGGGNPSVKWAKDHYDRVIADGGTIVNNEAYQLFFSDYYKLRGTKTDTFCLTHEAILGYKLTNGKVSKLYSLNPNTDLEQTTDNARPIFINFENENYYYSNNAGKYKTDKVYLIPQEFDIKIKMSQNTVSDIFFKRYQLLIRKTVNTIVITLYPNNSSSGVVETIFTHVSALWQRLKRGADNMIEYYTSDDGDTWTLHDRKSNTTVINQTIPPCETFFSNGYSSQLNGNIYRITINNLLDFNPINYNKLNYNQLTSTDDAIWSLYETPTTGNRNRIVYRKQISTDGIALCLTKAHTNIETKTNYFTSNFLNAFEVTDSSINIGKNNSLFYQTNTGFLISVIGADSALKKDQMRLFYDKYF